MSSSDARPFCIRGSAYRVYFPLFDADGDLVTGAAGLDSEISKDGGTFTDCTNEATEIATASGFYYLELTGTETTADAVCIIVKTSTTGAKTTPMVLYPVEAGDIDVDVTAWNGTAVATPDTAGYPVVTHKTGTGTGEISLSSGAVTAGTVSDKTGYALSTAGVQAIWDALTSALTTANSIGKRLVDNIDGTITSRLATAGYTAPPSAATNAAAVWDEARSGHTTAGSFGQGVASVQGNVTGSVASVTGAVGSVTGAVGSVTDGVTVTTNNDKTGYGLSAAAIQAIWDAAVSSLTTVGSIGKRIVDYVDTTISSRLATSGYTAPSNSDITAIKAKTDSLNFTGTDVKATLDGETVGLSASQSGTTFASLTVTGQLAVQDGVDVSASTTNRSAVNLTGNGTGAGLKATGGGGVTGAQGILAVGGASSAGGNGIQAQGSASGTAGVYAQGNGTGSGVTATGGTTGSGIYAQGGISGGNGMTLTRNHSSGDDFKLTNVDTNLFDAAAEGSVTVVQSLRAVLAYVAGKASGGGSTPVAFRNQADTKDRISMTVDSNGNRSAVTTDLT